MAELSDSVNGSMRIRSADVALQGPTLAAKYTDDAAVSLVIQDARRAQTFLDQKQWNLHWRESDVLFQSPRTNQSFEGSTVARANISKFVVAKNVNALVPAMKGGIFYEMPPFLIRPRPAMNQSTARAKTALYGTLLEDCHFEDVSEHALEYMTNFGTVICKATWSKETITKKVRKPKAAPVRMKIPLGGEIVIHTKESDEIVVTDTEITKEGPSLEVCELGSVLVDPTWRTPNALHTCAKYVIHVTFPTFKDLDKLREQVKYDEDEKKVGGYDIPSEEELKAYFFSHEQNAAAPSQVQLNLGGQNWAIHHAQNPEEVSSDDPLEGHPIKMLERWDADRVMAVLCPDGGDRGVLIRNDDNDDPFLPFLSANFWNIPNAAYGLGVGRLSGSTQRISKGLTDATLDILSYSINQMYLRDRGANAPTQQIRQRLGGIIDVDTKPGQKVTDVFATLELPKVPPEVFAVLKASDDDDQSTTGADEAFTQGSLPGRGSSAARTATGAGGIIAANAAKIQGPVGHYVKGILLPFIELIDHWVKARMSPRKIREILGEELGDAFELDANNFYESQDRFDCLAGAHLAAKKAMAQALPLMVQIFENAPLIQQLNAVGWMVDVQQLLEMFMEVSEWKNSRELIRRMTPQEQQKFQASNPGMQKTQGQVAAIGARHQAKSAEIDQQNEAAMAREMIGRASDEAALWDERRWDREAIEASPFAPAGG